jgi:nicotinate-nucleotide adenylyltransferase
MKAGILGGTFDPVHLGHLIVAHDAMERLGLDKLIWVPARQSPHKRVGPVADAEHRHAMVSLATRGIPGFEVSRVELDRPGISYTVDTLRELQRHHPGCEWVLLIGADQLWELHAWKDVDQILELCTVIPMHRPGCERSGRSPEDLRLPGDWNRRLWERWLPVRQVEISSSEIRQRLAAGKRVRYFVPESVEHYIYEYHLYGA